MTRNAIAPKMYQNSSNWLDSGGEPAQVTLGLGLLGAGSHLLSIVQCLYMSE